MRHRSFYVLITLFAAILLGARSFADTSLSASSASAGWILLPSGVPGAGGVLHVLPAGVEAGSIRRVYPIAEQPEAMAAGDGVLILVFPAAAGGALHQVRQIEFHPLEGSSGSLVVSDPQPLPPIERAGPVASLVAGDSGPIVLLARDSRFGGPRWALLHLIGLSWIERSLPPEAASATAAALTTSTGRLVLFLSGPDTGSVSMWTTRFADPSAPWQGHDLRAEPPPTRPIECGGQVLDSFESGPGERSLRLWRPNGASIVAVSAWQGDEDWLVAVGPRLVHLWTEGSGATPRLDCRVFAPTGQVVYEGSARTLAPVNPQELFLLGVLLATIAVLVVAFVSRPSDSDRAAITLPEGTALASSGARVCATAIDAAMAVGAAAAIWRAPLGSLIDIPGMLASDGGWLLGTTLLGLWIVVGGLCEWALKGSPGKRLVGLRTVTRRGGRVSPAQGIGRTAAKVLCPPLSALSFTAPSRLPPGSFGTLVVERID